MCYLLRCPTSAETSVASFGNFLTYISGKISDESFSWIMGMRTVLLRKRRRLGQLVWKHGSIWQQPCPFNHSNQIAINYKYLRTKSQAILSLSKSKWKKHCLLSYRNGSQQRWPCQL